MEDKPDAPPIVTTLDEVKKALNDILKEHIGHCISQICAKQDALAIRIKPLLDELSHRPAVSAMSAGISESESPSCPKKIGGEQTQARRATCEGGELSEIPFQPLPGRPARRKARSHTAPASENNLWQLFHTSEDDKSSRCVSGIGSLDYVTNNSKRPSDKSQERLDLRLPLEHDYHVHGRDKDLPETRAKTCHVMPSLSFNRTTSVDSKVSNLPSTVGNSGDSPRLANIWSKSPSGPPSHSASRSSSLTHCRLSDPALFAIRGKSDGRRMSGKSESGVSVVSSSGHSTHSQKETKAAYKLIKNMDDVDLLHTDRLITCRARRSSRSSKGSVKSSETKANSIRKINLELPQPYGSQDGLTRDDSFRSESAISPSNSMQVGAMSPMSPTSVIKQEVSPMGAMSPMSPMSVIKRESISRESMDTNFAVVSLDSLRDECDKEMLAEILDDEAPGQGVVFSCSSKLFEVSRWVLCICGVLPFGTSLVARVFCFSVLIATVVILMLSVALAIWDPENAMSMHLCTACYAAGALLGLVSLRARKIESVLGPDAKPLEIHARRDLWFPSWILKSTQRFMVVLLMWLAAGMSRSFVVGNVFGHYWDEGSSPAAVHLVCFWVVSGLVAVQTYSQLHTSAGLELMVDDYCIRIFMDSDIPDALARWNVIQAFLRRSSSTLEHSMVAVFTSEIVAIVLNGVHAVDENGPLAQGRDCAILWGISLLSPVATTLYSLLLVAQVTEKCNRVPSLVNSMILGLNPESTSPYGLDEDCCRVVDYITSSAAGFYIKGMRISAFMALKLIYLFGLAVLTLTTHLVRHT